MPTCRMTGRRLSRALVLAAACSSWAGSSLAVDDNSPARGQVTPEVMAQVDPPGTDSSHPSASNSRGDAGSSMPQALRPKGDSVPASDVRLGGEAALSRNLALYDSGQYDACVQGLKQMLQSSSGQNAMRPDQLDQAAIYLGACLIASGRADEADQVYADAIRANPQMRAPDNLVFPQTVVDRFLRVRERLLTDIRREERTRVQAAEQRAQQQDEKRKKELQTTERLRALARSESVVEKNKRWLAMVPFGVGQFQNDDNAAGWIFLGLEAALAGTCIAAIIVDENLANRAQEPGIDSRELYAKRGDAYWVKVASSWGFIAAAAGGIVHAQFRFVPERRHFRTRTLPPELDSSTSDRAPELKRGKPRPNTGVSLTGIQLGPQIGIFGEF